MKVELTLRKRWSGKFGAALMFEGDKKPLGMEQGSFNRLVLAGAGFDGKYQECTVGVDADKRRVIVAGLGKRGDFELERVRMAGAGVIKKALELRAGELGVFLPGGNEIKGRLVDFVRAVVEGMLLSCYRFTKYRQPKPDEAKPPETVYLVFSTEEESRLVLPIVDETQRRVDAVYFVRNLVNEPAANKAPMKMAELAKGLALPGRIDVRVMDRSTLQEMGMNGILAVGQGSHNPPCLVELVYTPKVKSKGTVVFVGKGVCFDSGGLSLKNAQQMENMKDDMAGAATVLGVFKYLQSVDLPYKVIGLTPLVENMIGGGAQKIGDVIRHYNGKTVEVANTDAEGRLILADALAYGAKFKPVLMINIATLTGACVVALGNECSGVMGRDKESVARLIDLGRVEGEYFWELPLFERYRAHMKSEVADMKNIGKPMNAGTIIGGLFLSEFVPEGVNWIHIDIAGTAFTTESRGYYPAGATGVPLRTMIALLHSRWG